MQKLLTLGAVVAPKIRNINASTVKYVSTPFQICPFGKVKDRIGPHFKKIILEEYGYSEKKVSKFSKMFETVFSDFDADTVFEIGQKNEFLLYKRKKSQITIESGSFGMNAKNIPERVIAYCTNALHAAENWLKKQC